MPKSRQHAPDQLIRKLAEGNKSLASRAELDEVCRRLLMADRSYPDGSMRSLPDMGPSLNWFSMLPPACMESVVGHEHTLRNGL
jgi:hypothetical protein